MITDRHSTDCSKDARYTVAINYWDVMREPCRRLETKQRAIFSFSQVDLISASAHPRAVG
jgi:hypothetical protein